MTAPIFNTLPRPPLTAEEASMIQENMALDRLVEGAMFRQEWNDAADLAARKGDLERRFQVSRERTWRAWMSREYPPNEAGVSA